MKNDNTKVINHTIASPVTCNCRCQPNEVVVDWPGDITGGNRPNSSSRKVIQLVHYRNTGRQPAFICTLTEIIYDENLSGWGFVSKSCPEWYMVPVGNTYFVLWAGPSYDAGKIMVDKNGYIEEFRWNPKWHELIHHEGRKRFNDFIGYEIRYPIEGNLIDDMGFRNPGIRVHHRTSTYRIGEK